MSDTFDATKNYKRVTFQADRDLLNTELNELQDMQGYERRVLLDRVFSQGAIISGLAGTVDGGDVTIAEGVVYVDGHAVNVPGTELSFPGGGEHTIYVDVFRRVITAADDPSLVSPLTGEPTAEREKWIATLQGRDTSGDPLPDGAIGRTVVPVYVFNRDTGEVTPVAAIGGDISSTLADHEARITDAEVDVVTLGAAINTHKTSADHDGRYYTKTQSDDRYTPDEHVGSGGSAHALVTESAAGFLGLQTWGFLSSLVVWHGTYDYNGDGLSLLPYDVVAGVNGFIWHAKTDGNSPHQLRAVLRAKGTSFTATLELYHITGSADLSTGSRVRLIENANPTVPGGKVYEVDFYADSFTQLDITAGGNTETGFSLSALHLEDLVCYDLDAQRVGKATFSAVGSR